jgi:hypothetical protein
MLKLSFFTLPVDLLSWLFMPFLVFKFFEKPLFHSPVLVLPDPKFSPGFPNFH